MGYGVVVGGGSELQFSPDGQYLASGGYNSVVKLWHVDGIAVKLPDSQNDRGAAKLQFSPDGQYLASRGDDGIVKLWQIDQIDGTVVTLPGQHESIDLQFSPNGQYLASGGRDGGVKLWPLELDYLMEKSCDWLRFYLNAHPEEKDELCPDLATSASNPKDLTAHFSPFVNQLSLAANQLSLFDISR